LLKISKNKINQEKIYWNYFFLLFLDNMHERQLIFESVLPSELDPARFSKPIIDGIEQSLTSNLFI
jgi:hypothetical protein